MYWGLDVTQLFSDKKKEEEERELEGIPCIKNKS